MNILITGANFINKGAQSMLFITVDRLREIFPDANICFLSSDVVDVSNYTFGHIYCDYDIGRIATKGAKLGRIYIERTLKNLIKFILRKDKVFHGIKKSTNEIEKADMIVDVSGYQLGDKWIYEANNNLLNFVRIAKRLEIPIIFMPQSFGPFDYKSKMSEAQAKDLMDNIQDLMQYPIAIFAREENGLECLREIGIKSVKLSPDLVLQTSKVDYTHIFKTMPTLRVPDLKAVTVGIVPNIQCTRQETALKIIPFYKKLISFLLERDVKIAIVAHSLEDRPLCKEVKAHFTDNDEVQLLDYDMSCLEYDKLVQQFEFVISSRFHGAVHALRNGIPCIVLGWAVKYQELLSTVNQEKYSVLISDAVCDEVAFFNLCTDMMINREDNRKKINDALLKIRKNDCFSAIEELFSKESKFNEE